MKIALIGYGKMGHAIEEAALSRGHEIVCRIDKDNQEDFDSQAFKSADVAIEFTAPSVAIGNYRKAFAAGVRTDIFLCLQFQSGSQYLLCRQQIFGRNHEPLPSIHRGTRRDSPRP